MAGQGMPGYAQYAQFSPAGLGGYPPEALAYAGQGAMGGQAYSMGQSQGHIGAQGAGARHGVGMNDLVAEIASGGNGLSSLTKMLDFSDTDFWKGALVGAAAVLLLTNESLQQALFNTGAKAKDKMSQMFGGGATAAAAGEEAGHE